MEVFYEQGNTYGAIDKRPRGKILPMNMERHERVLVLILLEIMKK